MKTCPICKARCFDDMEVCFGCMHRFENEQQTSEANAAPVVVIQGALAADESKDRPTAQVETETKTETQWEEASVNDSSQEIETHPTMPAGLNPNQALSHTNLYPGYQLVISLVPVETTLAMAAHESLLHANT